MSDSAGSSECLLGKTGRRILAALLILLPPAGSAQGRVYVRQEEALARVFPPPVSVERKTIFLDDEEAARLEKETGEKFVGRVVTYYVGREEQRVMGYAYFDTHLVRTLSETIMILVKPDGSVGRITLLAFDEPEDYLPKETWLEQFSGRSLGSDLAIRRGIRNLTGASLSAQAITSACRRILALHRLVVEGGR